MLKKFLYILALTIALSLPALAFLSPAMSIMAREMSITKCVRTGTVLDFDDDDYEALFGNVIGRAEITVLPDASTGTLTLDGSAVSIGTTITEERFDDLLFAPAIDFVGTTRFVLEGGNITGTVVINVTQDTNYCPQVADTSCEAQKNIAVFGSFSAADPDGDNVIIEIVSYPSRGSVSITGDGQYVYRPKADFIGKDSFCFRAVDVFGNKSDVAKVQIKVSKPASDIYFDDMKNHWAHSSAVKIASTGLMTGQKVDGKLCFSPDSDMTRGDFLALSLIMAGYENDIPFSDKTVFADDSLIPHNIKSYARYAYDKNIISGYDNGDGTVNFEPLGAITRSEAAVIVDKILGQAESSEALPSYTDSDGIPAWAQESVYNISSLGIMGGNSLGAFSPDKKLTRGEGAHIVCNIGDYVQSKSEKKDLLDLLMFWKQ